jgi:hypothetical protein
MAGRNIYPQDIEQSAAAHSKLIREGSVAAFQDDFNGVTIIAEIAQELPSAGSTQLCQQIQVQIGKEYQVPVTNVFLVRKDAVPRTTSGKIQRKLTTKYLKEQKLEILAQASVHNLTMPTQMPIAKNKSRSTPKSSPRREQLGIETVRSKANLASNDAIVDTHKTIEAYLCEWLAKTLNIIPNEISPESRFADFGLDSVTAVDLQLMLKQRFSERFLGIFLI